MGRTRPPVLVTRRLPHEALDRIAARCDMTLYDGEGAMARDQLLTGVAGKAGAITLLTDRVDDEFLDAAGHGVLACNTPEVLTETTADTAFALIMAAARRIAEGDRFVRSGAPWIWGPLMMLGQDVHHATLGVVGFGRIGQALARRARAFSTRVIYYDMIEAGPPRPSGPTCHYLAPGPIAGQHGLTDDAESSPGSAEPVLRGERLLLPVHLRARLSRPAGSEAERSGIPVTVIWPEGAGRDEAVSALGPGNHGGAASPRLVDNKRCGYIPGHRALHHPRLRCPRSDAASRQRAACRDDRWVEVSAGMVTQ